MKQNESSVEQNRRFLEHRTKHVHWNKACSLEQSMFTGTKHVHWNKACSLEHNEGPVEENEWSLKQIECFLQHN